MFMILRKIIKDKFNKSIEECNDKELYLCLVELIKNESLKRKSPMGKKKLYYVSAEFLTGKLLSNNLINLDLYNKIEKELKEVGKSIKELEKYENEPSLGNGGLGRLAACFLDSIATLGLNGDGVGLLYHFGLFRQKFVDNMQTEAPDYWLKDYSFLNPTNKTYEVNFSDFSLTSRMYDIDIIGYNGCTNHLHLFDLESVDESILKDKIDFDKTKYEKNLTLFLYPDDSDEKGKLLRLYQEYFMVSSAVSLILEDAKKRGSTLLNLPDYIVVQINDTHPSLIIPELILRLTEEGIDIGDSIDIVTKMCAYTNHTILAEASEKWQTDYIEKVCKKLLPIIKLLDQRVRVKYDDENVYIIDNQGLVNMARMDIHYSFSTNGVASLHTDILKTNELKSFYELYPEKFNNKTNGITPRRWLYLANPQLTEFLSLKIGDDFKRDTQKLADFKKYIKDEDVLRKLLKIKQEKKKELSEFLLNEQKILLDENSIFDIQSKRLHEYKRQQLNALYIIDKYLKIKEGEAINRGITFIYGAKAAPAYTLAKDIIHLILCLSKIIDSDPEVSGFLKVVMLENYNVTMAQKIIPACDISEQISLASKEASGTGNMKFMMNGAVTLGTEDGANVEIHQLVGDDNIYIFGASSDDVVKKYELNSYNPKSYYKKNDRIKKCVDFITSDTMLSVGAEESLTRLKNELINKDWFMTLLDFEDYSKTKDLAFSDFENRLLWAEKMLVNISMSGYFSSDRTIAEYNRDIWKIDK